MFIISPLGRYETPNTNETDEQYDLLSEYEQETERLITPINH